jgi:hypothetical protein
LGEAVILRTNRCDVRVGGGGVEICKLRVARLGGQRQKGPVKGKGVTGRGARV